jgi:hypothetical protein
VRSVDGSRRASLRRTTANPARYCFSGREVQLAVAPPGSGV